jgi:hypothetical protein
MEGHIDLKEKIVVFLVAALAGYLSGLMILEIIGKLCVK